jgi:hypothetical protein
MVADEKAKQLMIDYTNHGFSKKCNVVSKNSSYQIGFIGEEEFRRYLDENHISYLYLNDALNHDALPDNGDFIINGKLANLKTQIFNGDSPSDNWFANVNVKDYNDDKLKGIEEYHFIFYNPKSFKMFYGGFIEAHAVLRAGQLVYKDEPVTSLFNASATMYTIRLHRLKFLIPDTYQDKYLI